MSCIQWTKLETACGTDPVPASQAEREEVTRRNWHHVMQLKRIDLLMKAMSKAVDMGCTITGFKGDEGAAGLVVWIERPSDALIDKHGLLVRAVFAGRQRTRMWFVIEQVRVMWYGENTMPAPPVPLSMADLAASAGRGLGARVGETLDGPWGER